MSEEKLQMAGTVIRWDVEEEEEEEEEEAEEEEEEEDDEDFLLCF
jgi:hypothetical protein